MSSFSQHSRMEVDSKVAFKQRVEALGIGELSDFFSKQGWDSYGQFAYAIPSPSPGTMDEQQFRKLVVNKAFSIADDEDPPPKAAALRRLWFESSVVAVNELRLKTERSDDSAPRRIPAVELRDRKAKLKAGLEPGMDVAGDLDPGDSIVHGFG